MSWQGLLRQQLVHSPKKTSKNQAENIEERNKWWKRWNKSGNVQIWSRIWLVDFRTRGIFTLVISIQKMAPRCIFVYNSSSFLSGFELSMIWELESRLFQNSKKCPWKTIFFEVCFRSTTLAGGKSPMFHTVENSKMRILAYSFSLRIQGPLWNQFNIFIWSTVWSQNPSDCILISVTRPLFVYSPRMSAGSSVVEDRNPFPPNKGMPISL